MEQTEALPPTIAELPAVERLAALIDGLCAAIMAELAPRSWWGALFRRLSDPLAAQVCAMLRGVSERMRALAADYAAGMVPRQPRPVGQADDATPRRGRTRGARRPTRPGRGLQCAKCRGRKRRGRICRSGR